MSGMKRIELSAVRGIILRWPLKYAALASIGVTTGCRVSEILRLKRKDVIESGAIRERIGFIKLKTKKAEKREMTIPAGCFRDAVLRYVRWEADHGRFDPEEYLFPGRCEGHLSRHRCYNFFYRTLGPGHGTHWMRKTFAHEYFRYLLQKYKGDYMMAVRGTQEALGHSSLEHTILYLGLNVDTITETQKAIFGG